MRGDYYRLSLMSPFFNPGPIEYPQIPIYLAGVNTGLARLAGEVADGFQVHPFHTPRYLSDVLLPAIQQGAAQAGREPEAITVAATAFIATNAQERDFIRQQIAFYASTPSYRRVMQLHGWENIAEQLSGLAAHGKWGEMPALIDDDMLATFAVLAEAPEDLAAALQARYIGLVDRLSVYLPFVPGERDGFWRSLLRA